MAKEADFRKSFERLLESSQPRRALSEGMGIESRSHAADMALARADSNQSLNVPAREYEVQRPIRSWLGKEIEFNDGMIGTPPGFIHLEGTDSVEFHYVTTMFVDIRNSTKLALKYDLLTVQWIKNAILRAASEVVRALDGHVHRFMGDALMAFFGGPSSHKESSALSALTCSAFLRLLMENSVIPSLKEKDIDARDLGFRVGVDFGDDTDVLWSSYGYSQVNEVTATSFYVDVSAKLQSMASKDHTMLGGNLRSFLDLPDFLTKIKEESVNGSIKSVPYLRPNFEKSDGTQLNYPVRELNYESFVRLLPMPVDFKSRVSSDVKCLPGLEFFCRVQDSSGKWLNYPSISRCLPKGVNVEFHVRATSAVMREYGQLTGSFIKTNFGKEAKDDDSVTPEVRDFVLSARIGKYGQEILPHETFTRSTAYRGIHVVELIIKDKDGRPVFMDAIGVHIE